MQGISLIIDADGVGGKLRAEDIAGTFDTVTVRIEIDRRLGQGEASRDMHDIEEIDIDDRGERHYLGSEIYRQRLRGYEVLARIDNACRGAAEEAARVKIDTGCPVKRHRGDYARSLVDLYAHSG